MIQFTRAVEALKGVVHKNDSLAGTLVVFVHDNLVKFPGQGQGPPPLEADNTFRANAKVRLQLCHMLSKVTQAAPKPFLKHLQNMMLQIGAIKQNGYLGDGEFAVFMEGRQQHNSSHFKLVLLFQPYHSLMLFSFIVFVTFHELLECRSISPFQNT